MTGQTDKADTLRLDTGHLDEIRAGVEWQSLFNGLGLRRDENKSKRNDWWAFSPFHDEKTASFHMGPGGLWYDFSVSEGGGAIELVQRLRGGNCYEAARLILESGWTTARILPPTPERRAEQTSRKVDRALEKPQAPEARTNAPIRQDLIPLCTGHDLLDERGISEETCDLLGIGFLPQGKSPMRGRIVFQIADARPGKSGEPERVILSHIGRAVNEDQNPKYLFYEGFHKSLELYGQELLTLHEDAAEQVSGTGHILLTEGPFDVAKAIEAGFRNVVGSFGVSLSEVQAGKLAHFSGCFRNCPVLIAYDRDKAGRTGAAKAQALLSEQGVTSRIFDWDAPVGKTRSGPVTIPETITDLGDFSPDQLCWLRARGLL